MVWDVLNVYKMVWNVLRPNMLHFVLKNQIQIYQIQILFSFRPMANAVQNFKAKIEELAKEAVTHRDVAEELRRELTEVKKSNETLDGQRTALAIRCRETAEKLEEVQDKLKTVGQLKTVYLPCKL